MAAAVFLLVAAMYLLGPVATSLIQAAPYSSLVSELPEQERLTARRSESEAADGRLRPSAAENGS